MGLKILHTADWHMGSGFASFSREQQAFLRREQERVPEKVAQLCRRENCDLMLLAGDIFDGNPSRRIIGLVKQALADCGVPVFVTPGNHDFCTAGSVWLEEGWPENVTVFTGGMESRSLPELDCRIWGAGYQSMDCDPLLEGFRAEGREGCHICVLHGDAVASRSPYCPVTAAQVRESALHYLALGHIHKGDSFRAGETLCAWPGCPMGRGWDETGEKGVLIAELDQAVTVTFSPLDTPRFYDLEADISRGVDPGLPAAGSSDFYRITLTGEREGEVTMPKGLQDRFPNLFLRDRTVPKLDLWEDVDSDTFRGIYFRLLQQSGTPGAVLAAEISKKILAGQEVRLP